MAEPDIEPATSGSQVLYLVHYRLRHRALHEEITISSTELHGVSLGMFSDRTEKVQGKIKQH